MIPIWKLVILVAVALSCLAVPSNAQSDGARQEATRILDNLPPDLLFKVQALAQILQQGVRDGKLTDSEIQQGLLSGQLAERIQQLGPEAGQLLDEISDASRRGVGPGEDSLMPLLGGLGISPD